MKKREVTIKGRDEAAVARRITAIVVAATLLVLSFFGVLIYQWVKMGTQTKRLKVAEAERAALEAEFDEKQKELDGIDEGLKYDYWLKYEDAQNK